MANPPRKPGSRRPQDLPEPMADLFATASQPLEDKTPASPTSDPDEWDIDSGTITPAKPRPSLPAEPIPAAADRFESNPAADSPPTLDAIVPPKAAPQPKFSPAPSAASTASTPAPAESDADPFHIDDDLPLPAPRTREYKPTPEPEIPSLGPEDFTPSTNAATDSTGTSGPSLRRNAGGLLLAAALLLTLLAIFASVLYSHRPNQGSSKVSPQPNLPITGQLITLSDVTTNWRARQPGDVVNSVDVTLPTPGRAQPAFLPQVQFTLDSDTKSGFLRFIFLDPDGKISGDVRIVKINGTTIEPLASGAIPNGATASIYGSLGFMDRASYTAYATADSTRWAVEVSESSDANSKESGWTKLDTFELRNSTSN